jgi:polyisoprenoid-binding protein YceI
MKASRIISATLTLLLLAATLNAQTLTRFDRQPGSKVKVDGSGNTHDWSVESQIVGGHLDLDSAFLADPQKATAGSKIPAQVEASIPVRSLKSGKSMMDNVMNDAMHQKEHPQIDFRLKELTLKETPKSANGPFQFDSVGDLTINGVTNSIKMPISIQRLDSAKLKTTGSIPLKMTSFGIKPPAPKLGLGLLRTDDDVKVSFDWLTAQEAK